MTVELSSAAIADANQVFNWYEDQSEGLGHVFTVELRRMLRLLGEYPELGPVVLGETRQVVLWISHGCGSVPRVARSADLAI